MEAAYDPERVRHLGVRVEASIDALSHCRAEDSLAADAMSAVRLTRRHLEEMWMPLIREIERSTAMTSWIAAALDPMRAGRSGWSWWAPRPGGDRPAISPQAESLIELLQWPPRVGDVRPRPGGLEVEQAITQVLADPQACLDVLSDRTALAALADWEHLSADLVERLVRSGLYDAVVARPGRLAEGYAVLANLTELANGDLDDGFRPGVARGVAVSMAGYITTLAPAIRQEGDYPVFVLDERAGVDVRLGTYDDVVDLFGALLRDDQAQAALGMTLGGYAAHVVGDLGADLISAPDLGYVAAVTDLVSDAARAEQAEMVAAATAAASRWQAIGETIGFGVGTALSATGAGLVPRVLTDRAKKIAVDFLGRVDPDQLPVQSIRADVFDVVTVATITMAAERSDLRGPLGLGAVTTTQWAEVDRRLARVAAADAVGDRRHRLAELDRWIATDVAPLAGLLAAVRTAPGMSELTESRGDADPDD